MRAGAILPLLSYAAAITHGSAARPFDQLVLAVYTHPAVLSASAWLYEDDGLSEAYMQGQYANTSITYSIDSTAHCWNGTIETTGAFSAALPQRTYTVRLLAFSASSAHFNGASLPRTSVDGVPGTFFSTTAGTSIYLLASATMQTLLVSAC